MGYVKDLSGLAAFGLGGRRLSVPPSSFLQRVFKVRSSSSASTDILIFQKGPSDCCLTGPFGWL